MVMSNKECSIDGCSNNKKSHGLCSKHAERLRKHGDPHFSLKPRKSLISYIGIHAKLRRKIGKASLLPCSHCNEMAQEWAYNHQSIFELSETMINRHGNTMVAAYSPRLVDYIPLCKRCHAIFDKREENE
jgi:hypothetical protein